MQGLAFDDRDRLWASEFGAQDYDELNLIERGTQLRLAAGRGPRRRGPGIADPHVVWETAVGLTVRAGLPRRPAVAGRRCGASGCGGSTSTGAEAARPTDFFVGEYGRMRTVVVAPDGSLWVTTSNRDGRGDPAENDDRILVIDPS